MDTNSAIAALSALAQETRLKVFRLLVQAGPEGLAAGEIARMLKVPPATLSFHLNHLETAGLITSERQQRRIIYAADYACCQGRPELCGDLIAACEPAADGERR